MKDDDRGWWSAEEFEASGRARKKRRSPPILKLRMPFATSTRWQGKLATFAECQLNGFANCRAVERV
jgi:hypothetical protein